MTGKRYRDAVFVLRAWTDTSPQDGLTTVLVRAAAHSAAAAAVLRQHQVKTRDDRRRAVVRVHRAWSYEVGPARGGLRRQLPRAEP